MEKVKRGSRTWVKSVRSALFGYDPEWVTDQIVILLSLPHPLR